MPGRRKKPAATSGYLRARHAFGVEYEGEMITVDAGEIVPAGSPLLKQIGDAATAEHFEPVTSFGRWDVPVEDAKADEDDDVEQATAEPEVEAAVERADDEQATAAPGEKRGKK